MMGLIDQNPPDKDAPFHFGEKKKKNIWIVFYVLGDRDIHPVRTLLGLRK